MIDAPISARSVTVAVGRLERWIAGFGERHGDVTTTADAGTVLLVGADGARAWIGVPFPPLSGDSTRELVEHVTRTRRVGVLLVRRGGHAAGVFEGARLIASKVGSNYVQGTTKAGGWSQQRYARRRANQASAAFADAADDAVRILCGHDGLRGPDSELGPALDGLVTGGDKAAVRAVLDDRRLVHLTPLVSGPWLQVKDPRFRVLAATPEQFRVVTIRLDP